MGGKSSSVLLTLWCHFKSSEVSCSDFIGWNAEQRGAWSMEGGQEGPPHGLNPTEGHQGLSYQNLMRNSKELAIQHWTIQLLAEVIHQESLIKMDPEIIIFQEGLE